MHAHADPSFGIEAQTLEILKLLSSEPPTFAEWDLERNRYLIEIRTFPWYNFDETGVALTVHRDYLARNCLVITFGVSRRLGLFVHHWPMQVSPINGPVAEDLNGVPSVRIELDAANEVVGYIMTVMEEFYRSERASNVVDMNQFKRRTGR